MPKSLDDLLRIGTNALGEMRYALIGGCARNLYAPPRATRDVDLAIDASQDEYQQLGVKLRAAGFLRLTETKTDPGQAVPDVALFSDASGGRIDLLFAHTEFEKRAIDRARSVPFPVLGLDLKVARVEDLIIYKLLASRPRDLIDIEEIIRSQPSIDWAYVEAECREWDALDSLHAIRARAISC